MLNVKMHPKHLHALLRYVVKQGKHHKTCNITTTTRSAGSQCVPK